MDNEIAVSAHDLGKCYRIYPDSMSRVKEWVTRGRAKAHEEKWALKGVSFDLPRGSALGLIGGNGAGKSTLLKILTGTTRPTTGSFKIRGRLGSLLELGAGFHPDFTGKDNLYMNAAMLGIPKSEVKRRFEEVSSFAELGDYLMRPVRTYSSGMAMRLGFAVAMMSNPDVLILDEILAVGDQYFQKKCMDRIREIRASGATILFVSHSTYHVRQICDRAIWLQNGEPVLAGDPTTVTDEYVNFQFALSGGQSAIAARHGGHGAMKDLPHLSGITMCVEGSEEPASTFVHDSLVDIHIDWRDPARTGRHHFGFIVYRNDDQMCFGGRTSDHIAASTSDHGRVTARVRMQVLAGEYFVSGFMLDESCEQIIDQRLSWQRFKVTYAGMEKGMFRADITWKASEPPA